MPNDEHADTVIIQASRYPHKPTRFIIRRRGRWVPIPFGYIKFAASSAFVELQVSKADLLALADQLRSEDSDDER